MAIPNYDNTGTSAAGGNAGTYWVMLPKSDSNEMYFSVKRPNDDPELLRGLSGYLDSVDLRFQEGNAEKNISPHWEFVISFKTKDDVRGVEVEVAPDRVVKLATFKFSVPMHRHYMVPTILNPLAAAIENGRWDMWVKLNIFKSDNDKMGISLWTSPNGKEATPNKFPFNYEEGKGYVGVPNPRGTGAYVQGKEVYDWHEVDNFWLRIAKTVYEAVNLGQEAPAIAEQTSSAGYNPNGTPAGRPGTSTARQEKKDDAPATTTETPKEKALRAITAKLAAKVLKSLPQSEAVAAANELLKEYLAVDLKKYGLTAGSLGEFFANYVNNDYGANDQVAFDPTLNELRSDDLPF